MGNTTLAAISLVENYYRMNVTTLDKDRMTYVKIYYIVGITKDGYI